MRVNSVCVTDDDNCTAVETYVHQFQPVFGLSYISHHSTVHVVHHIMKWSTSSPIRYPTVAHFQQKRPLQCEQGCPLAGCNCTHFDLAGNCTDRAVGHIVTQGLGRRHKCDYRCTRTTEQALQHLHTLVRDDYYSTYTLPSLLRLLVSLVSVMAVVQMRRFSPPR